MMSNLYLPLTHKQFRCMYDLTLGC